MLSTSARRRYEVKLHAADSQSRATVCHTYPQVKEKNGLSQTLCDLEAVAEFGGDSGDAFLRCRRERRFRLGVRVAEDDPQAGAVDLVVPGANGTGELREFQGERSRMCEIEIRMLWRTCLERRMGEEIQEDSPGVVDEVAETLRDKDHVNVARRGLLQLFEVVFGKRFFKRYLDGSRRLVFVWGDVNGHG